MTAAALVALAAFATSDVFAAPVAPVAPAASVAPVANVASVAHPDLSSQSPAARIAELRRGDSFRTVSSDGSVIVEGEALSLADRIEISGFVSDVRRKALELFRGGAGDSASMRAPGGSPFSPAASHVTVSVVEAPSPMRLSSRLLLPDDAVPGFATLIVEASGPVSELDAHRLGAVVVNGWMRLAVLRGGRDAGKSPASPSAAVPPWFSKGLLRSLDSALRQADFDSVRAKWGAGMLPPFDALASFGSPWAESDDALAAQLVSFWLSFPDRPGRFSRLVDALSSTVPWTADLFALSAIGVADSGRADAAFDKWLVSRESAVLTPGVATAAGARRLVSSLWLVPGRDGVPASAALSSPSAAMPPEVLFLPENAAWAPAAAARLRRKVQLAAAGRGDAWRAACARLESILERVERGATVPEDADRMRACFRDLAVATSGR